MSAEIYLICGPEIGSRAAAAGGLRQLAQLIDIPTIIGPVSGSVHRHPASPVTAGWTPVPANGSPGTNVVQVTL